MKRWKVRGRRRYYRNLAKQAPFEAEVAPWIEYLQQQEPGPCYDKAFYAAHRELDDRLRAIAHRPEGDRGYDFDHIHFDRGEPLFRWKAIRPHLDLVMRLFARLEQAAGAGVRPFQCWISLGMQPDYGMHPTLYFHTPNVYCDYFPHVDRVSNTACNWPTAREMTAYLDELLRQGYTVLMSAPTGRWEDIYTHIVIYKEGFGESLLGDGS